MGGEPLNDALKELDSVFDSIIDELENPGRSYGAADLFRNLHGEKTEYADYAKVVFTVVVQAAEDNMSATISVISTAEKIRRYTVAELNRAIRAKGIVYGIDSEVLMDMVAKQIFNREVIFAHGTPPENGIDGTVEHLIKFRSGAVTADIKKDRPICQITPPTTGISGVDIFGNPLHAENGAPVSVPMGENTTYDKKTGILSAAVGGSLSYKNGVYSISDHYIISGAVTKENGKIEFAGDVVIMGNISDEAVIIAEKSVTVKGKIKDSIIIAKQGLVAELSVRNSKISTETGDMKLMSCYDSEINCGGDLEAASLYNCVTKCTGDLSCTLNQGSINGGETSVIGRLSCITAGSRLHEKTFISVGDCSEFIAEKIMLNRSKSRTEAEIEKISRRISTLEIQKNDLGFLSREDQDFYTAALRIKAQKEAELVPLKEKLAEIERIIASSADSTLKVQRSLHANVTIKIKDHKREIDAEFGKITAYANDYGIIIS